MYSTETKRHPKYLARPQVLSHFLLISSNTVLSVDLPALFKNKLSVCNQPETNKYAQFESELKASKPSQGPSLHLQPLRQLSLDLRALHVIVSIVTVTARLHCRRLRVRLRLRRLLRSERLL